MSATDTNFLCARRWLPFGKNRWPGPVGWQINGSGADLLLPPHPAELHWSSCMLPVREDE
jgi:hypothetical protein